jgi:hypothetical protein
MMAEHQLWVGFSREGVGANDTSAAVGARLAREAPDAVCLTCRVAPFAGKPRSNEMNPVQ